ncbi:MAG: XRE family transcriptional regulator [Clostridia bacterium]|jgi:Zn-dependent peptidase ImmA (M78 family)/plasmid maintenance system antidote protein VapI|nr:XRE family transcriptional regulator [Clostridia bacterium]
MSVKDIGNNILYYLKEQKKTQVDLAEGIGTSKQIINKIVKGKKALRVSEISKIANYLNVDIKLLIEGKNDEIKESYQAALLSGRVRKEDTVKRIISVVERLEDMQNSLIINKVMEKKKSIENYTDELELVVKYIKESQYGIIKDDIFSILKARGYLIFFPMDEEDLYGMYLSKNGENYYIINSLLEREKQVFIAAHELAHSYKFAKVEEEMITSRVIEKCVNAQCDNKIESKANEFARKLLVDEEILKKVYKDIDENDEILKTLMISSKFLVPYKIIVERLYESKIIELSDKNKLLKIEKDELLQLASTEECCRLNYEKVNQNVELGQYVKKAIEMYDNDLYTYNKLKQALEIIEKKPEEYGIKEDEFNYYSEFSKQNKGDGICEK